MKRILVLGGGGFLMEDAAAPIDDYLRRLTGKSKPRICFIPTPSGDLPEQIDKFYAAYGAGVCEPSDLSFFRKPAPRSVALAGCADHLLAQDAVVVGGGNTKSALGVWREWGLDRVLADAYAAGVLLAGVSAGAICWFEVGLTDSFWGAGYRPLSCLGLLRGACSVHHNDQTRRASLLAAVKTATLPSAIAIDDGAAVLYEDGTLVRVISWRGGATAYAVTREDGAAVEIPYASVRIGGTAG